MITVDALIAGPCPWPDGPGDAQGVILSSRVRLARSWSDYAFHRKLSRARQQELTERLVDHLIAVLPDATPWHLARLTPLERGALAERQAISRELSAAKRPGAVVVEPGNGTLLAAMVNEEDHLRLQVIGSGLCLGHLLTKAITVDQDLAKRVTWSAHPRYGHLNACHTNLGTGLRASVMLHLPALAETGELKSILRACAKLHLAVRGQHGEGSEAAGHCYQISNARSLGHSEEDYLAVVLEAVQRVVAAEHLARAQLLTKARTRLEDKVFRAWGMLTSARRLSTEELLTETSWLRLGVALDVLGPHHWAIPTGLPADHRWRVLDRLALEAQPSHVQLLHAEGADLEPAVRDEVRADLVRRRLGV